MILCLEFLVDHFEHVVGVLLGVLMRNLFLDLLRDFGTSCCFLKVSAPGQHVVGDSVNTRSTV